MVRRLGLIVAGAFLLSAVSVAPVLADTEPAPVPLDDYLAGGAISFTSGGIQFDGYAQAEYERISNVKFPSFFYRGSGPAVLCDYGTPDPSDDEYLEPTIEFATTTIKATVVKIKTDSSRADVTLTMKGVRRTYDACTGDVIKAKKESHVLCFELKATAPGSPETDVQIVTTDSGTYRITSTYEYRPASATARLDGKLITMTDSSIQHVTQAVEQL